MKLNLVAGISAPGDEDDIKISKEMPAKLREATTQALLQHKLRRLEESAKLEIFKKELKELQSQDDDAKKAESYESARKIINSGALSELGSSDSKAARAMTAFEVAAGFPRSHTGKTGGARRLTLAADGTPQVIEKGDIQDEQQTNETTNKKTKSKEFNVREWLEQE